MLNGENLKGYNLPLGATNIMTTGDEYHNIFPVWDWMRVPGTTAIANPSAAELRWYHFGANHFGGGVSSGHNGIIAYEHLYNGVQARKAYFFMGNLMLCMGAGIEAVRTQMVTTSVNQCFLKGDVHLACDGKVKRLESEKLKSDNVEWVHHDRVGYIFPNQSNLIVQQKEQSGAWRDIDMAGSTKKITHKVFSIWKEHGYSPANETYCYMVVPDLPLDDFQAFASDHGFKIICNETNIQAVGNTKTKQYGVVFYRAGTVILAQGLTLSVDKPAIVYVETIGKGYKLSVADPLYCEKSLQLSISRKYNGNGITHNNEASVIDIPLPQDDFLGSTTTVDLR